MCHCDWFNKELNGQQLGRKRLGGTSGDREDLERKKGKGRVTSWMQRKLGVQKGR